MTIPKKITALLLALLAATPLFAQDMIVRRDGTIVASKVMEISSSEIKYKKFTNPDGPLYSLKVSEVLSINFQNGEVERFEQAAEPAPQASSAPKGTPEEPLFIEVGPDADNQALLDRYNGTRVYCNEKASSKILDKYHYKFGVTKNSVLSSDDVEIFFDRKYYVYTSSNYYYEYDIRITNKTDQTLYFDLSKCFRINPDGSSHTYYDGSRQTAVTNVGSTGLGVHLGAGITVGGGAASATTTVYTNERILTIPPHAHAYLSTHKEVGREVVSTGEPLWRRLRYTIPTEVQKGRIYNYTEEDSPGFIRYTLTYSKDADFSTYSHLKMNLFIQQVIGVSEAWSFLLKHDKDFCIVGLMAYR